MWDVLNYNSSNTAVEISSEASCEATVAEAAWLCHHRCFCTCIVLQVADQAAHCIARCTQWEGREAMPHWYIRTMVERFSSKSMIVFGSCRISAKMELRVALHTRPGLLSACCLYSCESRARDGTSVPMLCGIHCRGVCPEAPRKATAAGAASLCHQRCFSPCQDKLQSVLSKRCRMNVCWLRRRCRGGR